MLMKLTPEQHLTKKASHLVREKRLGENVGEIDPREDQGIFRVFSQLELSGAYIFHSGNTERTGNYTIQLST